MPDLPSGLLRLLAKRIEHGTLRVEGPGGSWSSGSGDPLVTVEVHDRRAYSAILRRGSTGLAESYRLGWWDCDDLTDLVRLLLVNMDGVLDVADRAGRAFGRSLSGVRRFGSPDVATDRGHIEAHYDLPPALFEAMLDDTMTYSCAVFEPGGITLGEAQRIKLDRICAKLDLGPSDHLLEIGTGWGALAIHAADRYGCRVTTTTISPTQEEAARRRVASAGLADRVEVLGTHYRDLTGIYDKVVSVEMIEAVDWRHHDQYFAACERLLAPEGVMVLQAIVIADQSFERAKLHADFIRSAIFPGGCIPSVTAIAGSLTRATRMRMIDLEDIGCHYPVTLAAWRDRLAGRWTELARTSGLDESFRRLWTLYLSYCEAAFIERHISDVQIVLAAPRYRPAAAPRYRPRPGTEVLP